MGHIATLNLVTNKTNSAFIKDVNAQLPFASVWSPETHAERKPNPTLLKRALVNTQEYYNGLVGPDQAVMIGDKYTGDMKAAKAAGIALGFWVKRLGSSDHLGDRLIRRPYERILGSFVVSR
jgi:histidinol phosphatase-like enzyme